MKRSLAILLAALLSLSLTACGSKPTTKSSSGSSSASDAPSYEIAVVLPETDADSAPFLAGIEDFAIEHGGADITPHNITTAKEELDLLATFDPDNQQGLISLPIGGESTLAELSRLRSRGLSVAIAGTDTNVSYATCSLPADPYELGKLAGTAARKYIEEQLGGKATVAIAGHSAINRNESVLRINGFLDQLSDMEGVKLTAELDLSDPEVAEQQFRTFFEGNAAIDLIFCTTDQGLAAANTAAIALGSKAALFGAEAGKLAVESMMQEGNLIQSAASQDYYKMGRFAAEAILADLTGETPPEAGSALPTLLSSSDTAALEAMKQQFGA